MGSFEPLASFLLPSESVIERLAIPITTFSLFPLETSTTYDHDDGIPNSTIYVSVRVLGVKAEKVVLVGFSKRDSGNHENQSRFRSE